MIDRKIWYFVIFIIIALIAEIILQDLLAAGAAAFPLHLVNPPKESEPLQAVPLDVHLNEKKPSIITFSFLNTASKARDCALAGCQCSAACPGLEIANPLRPSTIQPSDVQKWQVVIPANNATCTTVCWCSVECDGSFVARREFFLTSE